MADLSALSLLMNAGSKVVVQRCFGKVFFYRAELGQLDPSFMMEELRVQEGDARRLARAILDVVRAVLWDDDVDAVDALLAERKASLDDRLLGLIKQVLGQQLGHWRDASVAGRPALPRLLDLNWRADATAATDVASAINVPSIIVNLKIQDQPRRRDEMPEEKNVTFELRRDALQTMLDGLGRIRDQLSSAGAPK